MMRRIVRFILICVTVVVINVINAYSYTESSISIFDSPSSSGVNECRNSITYNQVMTLENIKVKFTQNEKKYKFHITAKSNCAVKNIFGESRMNTGDKIAPFLYKKENFGDGLLIEESTTAPYSQFFGSVKETALLKIKNIEVASNIYRYTIKRDGGFDLNETNNKTNGDKYFIPIEARPRETAAELCYRNVTTFPYSLVNNGQGVEINNNASYIDYDIYTKGDEIFADNAKAFFDVTFSIEKEYIDDYRYLCFAYYSLAGLYGYQSGNTYRSGGYSTITNTIDLKEFISCNHEWAISKIESETHMIKCQLCEWEKEEKHNYKYEYDEISNDVCICSHVKNVYCHYEINDDFLSTVDKLQEANSKCDKIEVKKKTGYNFECYEKYEIRINNVNLLNYTSTKLPTTKVYIGNVKTIDDMVNNNSVCYKAVYTPIKYTFTYSNKTNLDEYIDSKLKKPEKERVQSIYYDKKETLMSHFDYDFIIFKGWSLTKGSIEIDFNQDEEIYNYTDVDLKNYILYPIYEANEYNILYNTTQGEYINGLQQTSKIYNYYIDEELLMPRNEGRSKVFSHYVDMYGNMFHNMKELREYYGGKLLRGEEEQVIVLFANFKKADAVINDDNNSSNTDNKSDSNDKNNYMVTTDSDAKEKDKGENVSGNVTNDDKENAGTDDKSTSSDKNNNVNDVSSKMENSGTNINVVKKSGDTGVSNSNSEESSEGKSVSSNGVIVNGRLIVNSLVDTDNKGISLITGEGERSKSKNNFDSESSKYINKRIRDKKYGVASGSDMIATISTATKSELIATRSDVVATGSEVTASKSEIVATSCDLISVISDNKELLDEQIEENIDIISKKNISPKVIVMLFLGAIILIGVIIYEILAIKNLKRRKYKNEYEE